MNYFEFYGIAETFSIDANALKKKFYELSKRYHPDFFANEGEEKQQEILELSTLNNKAYQVLLNPAKRTEYILQQHNLLTEGEKYQLDPDFLMEMMEINETLMDADDSTQFEAIKEQVNAIETSLKAQLSNLCDTFDSPATSNKAALLDDIKKIYYKQKYLLRIKDSLDTFAARL